VRIIAGKARGRALILPRGIAIRPTGDRVKEALFGIVDARLDLAGRAALDLFSGSGALALEALSRGAVSAVAVDQSRRCAEAIAHNARRVGLEGCTVLCMSVDAALQRLVATRQRFALVLADPPYDDDPQPVLQQLAVLELLEDPGMLVVEHRRGRVLPARCGALVQVLQRRYGDTELSVFALERADGSTAEDQR
jgi:16S rRNA (guanine(966)-N(2))-methyltransferase RsmD